MSRLRDLIMRRSWFSFAKSGCFSSSLSKTKPALHLISRSISSRQPPQHACYDLITGVRVGLGSHLMRPRWLHHTATVAAGGRLSPVMWQQATGGGGGDKGKGSKARQQHQHGSVLMQMVEKKEEPNKQLTIAGKVARASKDFTYLLVILGGFAVTGFLFWTVGSEFFSSSSPSTIFTKALKRVKTDPVVCELLGEPITGHGAESGRGRRRHLEYLEYVVEGRDFMRMKFEVDGRKRQGTAYLDLVKNNSGKYECRFLFVELKGYPKKTIIIEDNR